MKLYIYMKSGNVIEMKGVSDYKFKYNNEGITSLTIELNKWFTPKKRLLVPSIDLKQIEAIVRA